MGLAAGAPPQSTPSPAPRGHTGEGRGWSWPRAGREKANTPCLQPHSLAWNKPLHSLGCAGAKAGPARTRGLRVGGRDSGRLLLRGPHLACSMGGSALRGPGASKELPRGGNRWALARWDKIPSRALPRTGWPRPTPTSNAGIVGHTYATDTVVGHGSHLAGTPCAMPAGDKSTALAGDRVWWSSQRDRIGQCSPPAATSVPSHALRSTATPALTRTGARLQRCQPPGKRVLTRAQPRSLSGREETPGGAGGPAIAHLLSFICVYRGCGSGSWSLTSKLAPGSWRGHGHRQEQSDQLTEQDRPKTPLSGITASLPHLLT